ncbi:MAG: RNA polymerase sigma factor [Bacteroidia bacterium]|nr:RNA polymerase sigma factor [Bacteroidia bacterium]
MQTYTDVELINGCIKGIAHYEHALYNAYAAKLFAVALRYTHIHAEAEDVLQNAFVEIFKSIEKFKYEGSFEGWMRRIVARAAIHAYKNRLQFDAEDTLINMPDLSADALSQLNCNDIIKCISCMPDGYRIIFNLAVIEGYAHAEIATLLQIKEATSRSQLTKARAYLRNQLQATLKPISIKQI